MYVEMILSRAFYWLKQISQGDEIVRLGEDFGSLKNDSEIKADIILGEKIKEFLLDESSASFITIEGFGDFEVAGGDESWICVNPLDASLNYKMRGLSLGLPFSCCVTLLRKKEDAKFSDIIAGGVVDLRNGDIWLARKNSNGTFQTSFNHSPVKPPSFDRLDLGSQVVIGEMYYPENRENLLKAFPEKKGWLRNPGSAAYEMALVASGQVVAYICDQQKQHELGAGFALATGAGKIAVDFEGNDLGERRYFFNAQTPVILGENEFVVREIISRLTS